MALVPAICTQCGGKIEVDDTKEAGICQACGTPFITEKVINNYNTYNINNNNFSGANINVVSGNAENYLQLAESAITAGNGKEAVDYINKALEINPQSSNAWLLKMRSIEHIATVGDPQTSEMISYGENAIKFSDNKEQTTDEVYKYYLQRATNLMFIALSGLRDVERLKQLSKSGGISITAGAAVMKGLSQGDAATRNIYFNLQAKAVGLKLEVPEDYIAEHEDIQDSVANLAKLYVSICEADVERLAIYGSYLTPQAINSRKSTLETFKRGLPENKASQISSNSVEKNNRAGCYIATCVYGSYDCPPVWTLRRYRDNTLNSTWYGRLFVKCYYRVSPTLVKLFGKRQWFKNIWKGFLDKLVEKLNANGVEDTKYYDNYYKQ